MLQIMLTTQLPILAVLTFLLSFRNYRLSQQKFLIGLVTNFNRYNHMKANSGKCHLILSTKSPEVVSTGGTQISSSTAETLLSIINDS